jgi:hypothetical protein
MIREVTMYQALCDRCGRHDENSDYVAWTSAEDAILMAEESAFLDDVNGRLLCGDCWTWSGDDGEKVEKAPLVSAGTTERAE